MSTFTNTVKFENVTYEVKVINRKAVYVYADNKLVGEFKLGWPAKFSRHSNKEGIITTITDSYVAVESNSGTVLAMKHKLNMSDFAIINGK